MSSLQTSYYNINNPKLPHKKIMFLSDFHSEFPLDLHEIFTDEKPDCVLIAGDLFDLSEEDDNGNWDELLFNLRKIAYAVPVYCSLGNHEVCHTTPEYVKSKLEKNNICLLDDEYIDFDGIILYGFTPVKDKIPKTKIENFPEENDKTIVLCHKPLDYVKCVSRYRPFLTLSGHNHGGQWRFFGRGLYSPDEGLFPQYTCGFYFDNHLLVSRGLGNKCGYPRINNKPEVVILTLN